MLLVMGDCSKQFVPVCGMIFDSLMVLWEVRRLHISRLQSRKPQSSKFALAGPDSLVTELMMQTIFANKQNVRRSSWDVFHPCFRCMCVEE